MRTKWSTEQRRRRAVAATGGGARCRCGTERGEEEGEGQEAHELTRSTIMQTTRPEEAGVDGEDLGGAAARAEEAGTIPAIAVLPTRMGGPGRKRRPRWSEGTAQASAGWPGSPAIRRRWRRRASGWSAVRVRVGAVSSGGGRRSKAHGGPLIVARGAAAREQQREPRRCGGRGASAALWRQGEGGRRERPTGGGPPVRSLNISPLFPFQLKPAASLI